MTIFVCWTVVCCHKTINIPSSTLYIRNVLTWFDTTTASFHFLI